MALTLTTSKMDTVYRHTQTEPATEWTINHNLNGYPIIDVLVNYEGGIHKVVPKQVVYVNANTCRVIFNNAQTGYATVI